MKHIPKQLSKKILLAMKRYPSFYQKVWKACVQIPRGKTVCYGWIARKVGQPGAARAVGQALAKNPFAPLVPCHRVVGSKGKLVGYSGPGGLATKTKLLEKERRKYGNTATSDTISCRPALPCSS